ncbi:hypothetical protein RDI58_024893 [Solanum bulbocastanum]|uniref:Uncharacterized protein n=1 Tax=Solanum bulbocastanum TaxID=147425 RepID=A0AAN8SYG6_SOLBU
MTKPQEFGKERVGYVLNQLIFCLSNCICHIVVFDDALTFTYLVSPFLSWILLS